MKVTPIAKPFTGGEAPRLSQTGFKSTVTSLRAQQFAAKEVARQKAVQTTSNPSVRPPVLANQPPQRVQALSNVAPPPVTPANAAAAALLQGAQETTGVETKQPGSEVTAPPLSPQFAALARKERQHVKAQQDLKAAQDAWKQEQANYIPKSLLKSDPLKALAEAGISYDQVVESQLSQASPDPNQALLTKIAELEARLSGVDTTLQDRDKRAYDQAVAQIQRDTELLVSSDPAFETIHATESSGEVVDLIKKVFETEGHILTVEEAARLVEAKLAPRYADQVKRLSELSAIKKLLVPAAVAPAQEEQPLRNSTLTNTLGQERPLTGRERAIAAIERARQK
jgi:hypothetical protein